MRTTLHTFDELPRRALYAALRLRAEVFVVEQRCAYLDLDGVDLVATHVLGWEGDDLVACARVHQEDGAARISRVATSPAARGRGLGHAVVRACLAHVGARPCFLHAQDHLREFYAAHGFHVVGDVFDEDGIPHVRMERSA